MDMTNEEIAARIELCKKLEAAEQALMDNTFDMSNEQIEERLDLINRLNRVEQKAAG
jgi:hypothetical protein